MWAYVHTARFDEFGEVGISPMLPGTTGKYVTCNTFGMGPGAVRPQSNTSPTVETSAYHFGRTAGEEGSEFKMLRVT